MSLTENRVDRLSLTESGIREFAARLKNPIWIFDLDNKRILWANESALTVWSAKSLHELTARDMGKDMSESVARRLRQYRHDFIKSNAVFSENWTLYPNDCPMTLHVVHSGIVLENGAMGMLCEGLGEQQVNSETLRCAEALIHTTVMITLFTETGEPLYRNPAAREFVSDLNETFGEHFVDQADAEYLLQALDTAGVARIVGRVNTERGEVWHEITARRCRDAVTGHVACLVSEVDVNELKRTEAQALHLASHDLLTGLPNRKFVVDHFNQRLLDARAQGLQAALMFIDLDRFKYVNDTIGHKAGDELLVLMARRLQSGLRNSDLVARLGGDEFLVLAIARNIDDYAEILVKRVVDLVSEPCVIMHHQVAVTPSIGIAIFPCDGDSIHELMKHADLAMYSAKEKGRNRVAYFRAELTENFERKVTSSNELRDAVERKEFTIFLQPRLDVKNNRIVGAEALARWQHPRRGIVGPDEFIPLCEELGLISALGAQIFELAAQQQYMWEQKGTPLVISVNMSPFQFEDPRLLPTIQDIVARTHCNPHCLELEITESALLGADGRVNDILQSLYEMGFRIFIDDFGTGYSNLAYINRFPLAGLKIDRSFINAGKDQRAIAAMIIMMSRMMNVRVIAEGVETCEQLQWLDEEGCNEYQGFLFSRPVSTAEFAQCFEAQQHPDGVAISADMPR